MLLVLAVTWCVVITELFIYLLPASRLQRITAGLAMLLVAAATAWTFDVWPGVLTVAFSILAVYRIINLFRLLRARAKTAYIRRMTLQTCYWLIGLIAIATGAWLIDRYAMVTRGSIWIGIAWLQVGLPLVLLVSTLRHLVTTRPPAVSITDIPDKALPSLTVAIPARNETDDLEACLASLIASDYPKLEIMVLDDCSQIKRTPEIIRSFAHAGVRFLQGDLPRPGWLAKNQAYEQLYEAANGELIVFCGVDVRFTPDSLRLLVTSLLRKHKAMISVIPRNFVPAIVALKATVMVQTMRYAWELALPRRFFSRPPVLSTTWLIYRDAITRAGGFKAVNNSVTPESYFARQCMAYDGYSFMQSGQNIGLTSNKGLHEQHATAVRMQYPKLHRRLELVVLLSFAELTGLVLPYIVVVLGISGALPQQVVAPGWLSVALLTITYACVVTLTYRRWLFRSLLSLPIAALIDVMLLHESMIRYEFFEVLWKDRNVCIPVMHVTEPARQTEQ